MPLVTQAEFARIHNVSRKAVTVWKQRGLLEFFGRLIDVEPSNKALARLGRAWPHMGGNDWPAVITEPDAYDWTQMNGRGVGMPSCVTKLSVMADAAVSDMARLVLRHLPPKIVLPLLDEFLKLQRDGAVDLASDYPLPGKCASWADHPLFQGPALAHGDWEELLEEATSWKVAHGCADA